MKQVGPKHWHCVTPDGFAQPTGGMYGDVRRYMPMLAEHGLHLCWSTLWCVYGVYTQRPGDRPRFQMLLKRKGEGPLPLTRQLVETLIFLRESDARMTTGTITDRIRTIAAEARAVKQAKVESEARRDAAAAVKEVNYRLGLKTRPVTVAIP